MDYKEEQELIKENLKLHGDAIFWENIARMDRKQLINEFVRLYDNYIELAENHENLQKELEELKGDLNE
jgi:hypothetical protein